MGLYYDMVLSQFEEIYELGDTSRFEGNGVEEILPNPAGLDLRQLRKVVDNPPAGKNPWAMGRSRLIEILRDEVGDDHEELVALSEDDLRASLIEYIEEEVYVDWVSDWRDQYREELEHRNSFMPVLSYALHVPYSRGLADHAQAVLDAEGCSAILFLRNGDLYLGQSGAGMDLSFDYARACVLLGYYPPICLADRVSSWCLNQLNAHACEVVAAMLKSLEWAERRARASRCDLLNEVASLLKIPLKEAPLGIQRDWCLDQGRESDAVLLHELMEASA